MPAPRLLDRVHAAARTRHLSRRTEEAYSGWIVRFVRFHDTRHPRELGAAEVRSFLTDLRVLRRVASSAERRRPPKVRRLSRAVDGREADRDSRAGCGADESRRRRSASVSNHGSGSLVQPPDLLPEMPPPVGQKRLLRLLEGALGLHATGELLRRLLKSPQRAGEVAVQPRREGKGKSGR